MIKSQHVNPTATQVFMLTLTDGVSPHDALAQFVQEHEIKTATFDMLGGLSSATFTAYDFTTQTRHPARTISGALEIVAGHGTISQLEGQPHVHIHCMLAIYDANSPSGQQLVGGHLAEGAAFAVELTLTAYAGNPVSRSLHAGTGLQLWNLDNA